MEEHPARAALFRSLMEVTHRDYTPLVEQMRNGLETDPFFMSRALVYIATGGSKIRDQVDAAIIALLQANPDWPEFREAGRCVFLGRDVYKVEPDDLPGLPPFRTFRVESHIAGSDRKTPRQMKTLMRDYYRMLEFDANRADGMVIRNRRAAKNVWRRYHFSPGDFPYLHALLFGTPPHDSKVGFLKQIANASTPREQAQLAMQGVTKYKLPYPVISSVLPKLSPAVGIVLVESMSPTEALNSRRWVEQSGLLDISEVRDAFTAKVAQATASVASVDHRKSAKGTDEGVEAAKMAAQEKAVAQEKRIEGETDIYLDYSGSMDHAIEPAIQFASRAFPLCDDPLLIIHNDRAVTVNIEDTGHPLQDARKALRGVRACGGTLHHTALQESLRRGRHPDKIVLITDGAENGSGHFARSLDAYMNEALKDVTVVMIHLDGHVDSLTRSMATAGIPMERYHFDGDYFIFDQITALLAGAPGQSIVDLILETQLPRRVQ